MASPSSAFAHRRNSVPNLLGRGVKYPLQSSETGGFLMVEGEECVKDSIRSILETGIHERPFQVRLGVPFGTRIPYYQFDSVERLQDLVVHEVERALEVWEPRILVLRVELIEYLPGASHDPRYLGIRVVYRLRATNRSDNLVVLVPRRGTTT